MSGAGRPASRMRHPCDRSCGVPARTTPIPWSTTTLEVISGMSSCPSLPSLRRVGSGLPGDTSSSSLDRHINGCCKCQAALEDAGRDEPETTSPVAARTPAVADLPPIPGYEIERELGRGGMGVVYLAREVNSDRPVALKFLPSGPFAAPRDREHWLKEARAAARVRHPHVVQLHRVDEAGGWLYLVLEYVPGGSLKERLTGPLPARVAATLLVPIAQALEQLHRAGVWHLDLKPANILVDAAPGTPLDRVLLKLADFGIARSCDESAPSGSSRGAAQGTPLYMAPEQVAGRRSALGPATDIHAMGIILYELLTGRPPFLADSDAETMHQIQTQVPVPPRRLNPKVPRDLETICLKCLEKAPGRRYATAEALAEDLRCFLDGRPISARPVSPFERTWRWCRRRPAIASLTAALAATLASGFVGLFALWRVSEAERARVEVQRARAEVERARAEEAGRLTEDNEKVTSSALAELNDALYFAMVKPETISEDRILATTYAFRKQTSALKNYRRLAPRSLHGLGVLERELAARLLSRGQREEARALLIDSVAILKECRQLDPDDESILWQLAGSLWLSGHLAANEHRIEESLDFCDQASSLLDALRTLSFRVDMANRLYLMRGSLADELTRRGEPEQARRAIEANLRMFDSMERTVAEQPELAVCKELTLAELTPGYPAIERLRSAVRKFPDFNLRKELEKRITTWSTVNPFGTDRARSGLTRREDDPEAWAEALFGLITLRCSAAGLDAAAVPTRVYKLIDFASTTAAEQRRIRRLTDAEVTAARLMALARRLVRSYPSHPESHVVLSEAYFQVSKNAWKREDFPAIEQALRQALESARRAVSLAPQREDTRHFVDRLLPRLAMFDVGRAQPK